MKTAEHEEELISEFLTFDAMVTEGDLTEDDTALWPRYEETCNELRIRGFDLNFLAGRVTPCPEHPDSAPEACHDASDHVGDSPCNCVNA